MEQEQPSYVPDDDDDSSSLASASDTSATNLTPQWMNDNNGTVNSRSSALAYHEQVSGGGDDGYSDPEEDFGYRNTTSQNDSFDQSENDADRKSDGFSSDSDESEEDKTEAYIEELKSMLEYLEDKDRKEWDDDFDEAPKEEVSAAAEKEVFSEMLRKAVDRMDVSTSSAEVQRIGARIVYLVASKLQNEDTPDANPNDDDEEEEELMIDALDAILQAMEDFPDDEELIVSACAFLERISERRSIQTNAKRILEEILLAVEGFADNASVVSSSLGIFHFLSTNNGELRRKLAKYALPSILQGMKEHRDDLELYTKGCKAMVNFTTDDPNAQRILACKEAFGLRIIAEGMKYWQSDRPDESEVLDHLRLRLAAVQILKNLSTNTSLEVKGKIALGGGAARIVDRLLEALVFTGKDLVTRNYQVGEQNTNIADDEDVVGFSLTIMKDALEIIENLANIGSAIKDDSTSLNMPPTQTLDSSTAEAIKKHLTKAVKPVVNIIRQHPNRPSLQYQCLGCLRQLTISHADAIADQGGISTLLNILSSPGVSPSNETLMHERALTCLTGLLSPSSNADGLDLVACMETEDGLDTIFRTIRRYQSNTAVIDTAYEALFYVSFRIRVVLASIEGHRGMSCGVGAQAALRLENQLCLEENIFVMVGTLNQYYQTSESMSHRGLGLLVNIHTFLARKQNHQHRDPDILVSDGGIRLVLAVMRRHGLAVAIQEYGIGLLASILKNAVRYDAIRREFVDEEGISTVTSAMMIHPDHAAVQSHGFNLFNELIAINKHPMEDGYSERAGYSAKYKKILLEETNVVIFAEDAMQRFRSHKAVNHNGSMLLEGLSQKTAVSPLKAAIRNKITNSFR